MVTKPKPMRNRGPMVLTDVDVDIESFEGEIGEAETAILPTVEERAPMVGDWLFYQVRNGHRIPMLVTAMWPGEMVSGVVFGARHSDVGNAYGVALRERVRHGEGDGEWQTG